MAVLLRLLVLCIALPAYSLTVGEMEIGPDVIVEFSSGESASFDTWVNVTEIRQFEAVWKLDSVPPNPDELMELLLESEPRLREVAQDLETTSMLVSALWDDDGMPQATTCSYETLDSKARCFASP